MQELRCGDRENYHRHRGERQTSQGRYYRRPPTTRKLCFFCCRTARAIIGWKGQAFEATQSLRRMDQDSRTKMVPLERGYGDFLLMGFRQNHLTVGKTIRYKPPPLQLVGQSLILLMIGFRMSVMPDYFCPRSVLCGSSMLIRIKKSGGLGSNNFLFGDLNLKQRNRKRICNTEFNLIFSFCFPSYLFCCF
ncbi:uncharacterized protein LOC115994686 isoform X2 [Quercus lobata]|uniref:uncharacterized protein LOC115994686 isoform X2 n=1 Tax=Quercus lobata TaxID=97700 RepID=UPI0012450919|nr:uncharacterized protein LOC115994686 isoform X2 [Quercus lobata]